MDAVLKAAVEGIVPSNDAIPEPSVEHTTEDDAVFEKEAVRVTSTAMKDLKDLTVLEEAAERKRPTGVEEMAGEGVEYVSERFKWGER